MSRILSRCAAVAALSIVGLPTGAAAVPAFARQTGATCSSCHFQHFPALTPYGQTFKSGNYAQSGGQGLVEGDILSLPAVLNISMILKMKYVKTNGSTGAGTDRGEYLMPDEASILLGGRVGENMGFLVEGQLADEASPVFASFKVPIGFEAFGGRLSLIPFATDALGTPFGFELLSTGAVRNVRSFEERAATSAQQYVVGGAGEGIAEGVAFVYARANGFANVTLWTPNHGSVVLDRPTYYVRAAATPLVGSWQLGGGVQWWVGTATSIGAATRAVALDFQALGSAANMPLGIYLSYARAPGSPSGFVTGDPNFFNDQPNAQWAVAGSTELGILPGRLTVGLGYRDARSGADPLLYPDPDPVFPAISIGPPIPGRLTGRDKDRAFTMSSTVLLAQNVSLHLSHTLYSGSAWAARTDDQKFSMTLFAAF
jgi:hypothetical protein